MNRFRSSPIKYRKRPVVIEAIKYTGTIDSATDIFNWMADNEFYDSLYVDGKFYVKTLEGNMLVSPGNYVICGVEKEFYSCDPYIFEKTYEAVE